MRVVLGADHAGVHLKADIKQLLDARGIPYTDFGVDSTASVDYPDYAAKVAQEVGSGRFERGILFCGSGVGMAIAANKIHGVRAAAIVDETSARLSREHNDINVLSLGEGLLMNEIDSWMTGVNRNVEGKQTRRIMRYSGGHPAFREHCDAVAVDAYRKLALA